MADHSKDSNRYVSDPSDRVLQKEIVVPASIEDVWHAWTTNEGAQTFFNKETNIQLRLGGPFEIYFIPNVPLGGRGSEGCRILSFLPPKMLSFEWNAPPEFGPLRKVHTQAIIQFEQIGPNETRLVFSQLCWGIGELWDKLYDYFDNAWGFVLGNLQKRFIDGPLNWKEES